MKILFVCSSNVCRSPYCEFMFRRMVSDDCVLSKADISITSAAVLNHSKTIFPKAVNSLVKEGFDREAVLAHTPCHKRKGEQRFKDADVIIGMSRFHKLLTPKKYRNKYITLSEIAEGNYTPIPDPFTARSQADYDEAMSVIKGYLIKYSDKLKKQFIQE